MKIKFNYDVKNLEPIRINSFLCFYEAFIDTLLKIGDGEFCNEIFPISVQRVEDRLVGEKGLLIDVMLHADYVKVFPKLELVRRDGSSLGHCVIYTLLLTPNAEKICYAQKYVAMYHGVRMMTLEYTDALVRIRHTFNVLSVSAIEEPEAILDKFNASIKK